MIELTIEGLAWEIKAAKAVRAPLRARVHPETLRAIKNVSAAEEPPHAVYPWLPVPFGTPVEVDLDVSPGEIEWDYPEVSQ